MSWVGNCEKLKFKNFIRRASKIVHEWNGHLEVFSRPQVIENSTQYLLLGSDILKKTLSLFKTNFNLKILNYKLTCRCIKRIN